MNCGPRPDHSDWPPPSHGEELILTGRLVVGAEMFPLPLVKQEGAWVVAPSSPWRRKVRRAKGTPVAVRVLTEADTGSVGGQRSSKPF